MRKAQKAVAPALGGAGVYSYLSRGLRGLHGCHSAPLGESEADTDQAALREAPLVVLVLSVWLVTGRWPAVVEVTGR